MKKIALALLLVLPAAALTYPAPQAHHASACRSTDIEINNTPAISNGFGFGGTGSRRSMVAKCSTLYRRLRRERRRRPLAFSAAKKGRYPPSYPDLFRSTSREIVLRCRFSC